MRCARCSRDLPSAFPGATVTCVCGSDAAVPPTSPRTAGEHRRSFGPYRAAQRLKGREELTITCPYCMTRCSSSLRVCPCCDVRFDSVRCARCYTLQPPGSFACGRCGEKLDLEPLLDATDAPCPRCRRPLEAAGGADARLHECPRCGGIFIPREALADLLCRAELGGPFPEEPRARMALDEVTYLPCPLCHASMNRMNFGRYSGVIVDVCRAHGTWFDAGELTRVVAFAASGGLDKTRAREEQDKREDARLASHVRAQLTITQTRAEVRQRLRLADWGSFLRDLFLW